MRKYLFNGAVLAAIFGGIGVIRSTIDGPRDWRLLLAWVSWGATLAIAIGAVTEESGADELER